MSALISTLAAPRVVRLIAVTILLAVCWLAIARPWRSALLLDAALALLTIYRPWPILLALAVVQIAYRWSPPLATFIGELLDERFTGLTMATVRWWLPGWQANASQPATGQTIIMSRPAAVHSDTGTSSSGGSTGTHETVPGQQYHVEPQEPLVQVPPAEPSSLRNLTNQEEAIMLAVQRKADGSYRHSANDIARFVGGTRADVLGWVATIRGKKDAAPPPPASVPRPKNGW